MKEYAWGWIEDNKERIIEISDAVWEYAELGLVEYKSSKLLADELESHGFRVERGVAGKDTGEPLQTGHTFAGSPLSCAAGLVNIEVIEEEKLVENSSKMGAYLKRRLMDMMGDHRIIGDVRGRGLLIGVEIVKDKETKEPGVREADSITANAFQKGLYLVNMGAFGTRALRVAPPLIIDKEQVEACLEILESSISKVEREL